MKKHFNNIVLGLFFMLSTVVFSQGETRKWYFGNGLGLDFSTPIPVLLTNGAMSTTAGCSVISSSAGNLLFYTDGVTVWNQSHLVMSNGTGLFGNPGAQCVVIVKKPASNNLYYIFTVQGGGGSAGFCYSIVDMNLSAGAGSVTVKNFSLYPFPCEEKISATKHCNQTDAWIMVHEVNTSNYKACLLTSAGISTIVTTNIGYTGSPATYTHSGYSPRGTLKFSPNGRRMADVWAISNPTVPPSSGGITLGIFESCEFDNNTGVLYSYSWFMGMGPGPPGFWGYGTEFSPDGSKLYYSYLGGLLQYNYCIYPPTGNGSIVSMDNLPNSVARCSLQLGPDGKIYVANYGVNSIGVINNPNNAGNACNYMATAISTGSIVCGYGLPNFYTPYFEKPSNSFTAVPVSQNCQSFNFSFLPNCVTLPNTSGPFTGYVVNLYHWNFGDPSTGLLNTSLSGFPTHTFSSVGIYTVQLIVTYYCGMSDTIVRTVSVSPTHTVSVSSSGINCGTTGAIANAVGGSGSYSYSWSPIAASTQSVSNLTIGNHTVFVTDNNTGCIVQAVLNTNSSVIGGIVYSGIICSTATSGTANVIATTAASACTYSWTGSSSTSTFVSGLSVGIHTLFMSNNTNSCNLTYTFQVVQSQPITASINTLTGNFYCTGNNIPLSVTANGGTAPYTFLWSNASSANNILVNQTNPGIYNYSVTVTDLNGCIGIQTTSLSLSPIPNLVVNSVVICIGASATLNVMGAQSYNWLPGNINGSSFTVNPLSTTVYTITGYNGQCASSVTSTVSVYTIPTVIATVNGPFCAGDTLYLNGNGANTYSWSGPSGFSSIMQNPIIVNAQIFHSGIYQLTGINAGGCANTSSVAVIVSSLPIINAASSSPVCVGQSLSLTVTGGLSYSWYYPSGFTTQQQNPIISNLNTLSSGIYTVTGINNNSCTSTATLSIVVSPIPTVSISGPSIICISQSVTLLATGGTNYLWNNGSNSTSILVSPIYSGYYSVTGYNQSGCQNSTTFYLKVVECTYIEEITSNNIISMYPNPDFGSLMLDVSKECKLSIINPQGIVLFESCYTSGKHYLSSENLPTGIYIVDIIDNSGRRQILKLLHNN